MNPLDLNHRVSEIFGKQKTCDDCQKKNLPSAQQNSYKYHALSVLKINQVALISFQSFWAAHQAKWMYICINQQYPDLH